MVSEPNPFEPRQGEQLKAKSYWQAIDFVVAPLWLLIPLMAIVGRLVLRPIFADFGTELPGATIVALSPATIVMLAFCSIAVFVAIVWAPRGRERSTFLLMAGVAAVVIIGGYFFALIAPLLSLMQNLT